MEAAGIPVAGSLDDLLRQVDVVVDCSPKRIGAQNKARYQAAGVKAIWQGGEPHELAGYSFVAQANYAGAVGRDFARIVSCNTTALIRVLHRCTVRGWVKRAPGGADAPRHRSMGVAPQRDDQHRRPRDESAKPSGPRRADRNSRSGYHHDGGQRPL